MRVIAGKSKGRRINHDRSDDLRPTSAKVREALFNVVKDKISGSRFLELFAGTGAVGIEAISRGATEITFVEIKKRRAEKLKKVLESFGMSEEANIICEDVFSFLKKSGAIRYDIIFADPPYKCNDVNELITSIYNADMLDKDGVLLIEHSSKKILSDVIKGFRLEKQYKYGDTMISKFMKRVPLTLKENA